MEAVIHVIDDDAGVRNGLQRCFSGLGHRVEAHASAEQFLEQVEWNRPGCLVLDLVLPGMQGLDLLERVPEGDPIRTVVFTGFGDVPNAVRAMKAGASDFIEKPIKHETLLAAVEAALRQSEWAAAHLAGAARTEERIGSLTPAERVVLDRLVAGKTTAEIARELHRSDRTIGNHRQHILRKIGARNTAELIALITSVGRQGGPRRAVLPEARPGSTPN